MCTALNLLASSIKGRFSVSLSSFHSAPSLFDISELCILGFSWAIFRLWPRDHTMKAFMGLLTRSVFWFLLLGLLLFVDGLLCWDWWGLGWCCWWWFWGWWWCIWGPCCWWCSWWCGCWPRCCMGAWPKELREPYDCKPWCGGIVACKLPPLRSVSIVNMSSVGANSLMAFTNTYHNTKQSPPHSSA